MNPCLKPWTKSAFELIVHAELHLREGGDFDRRIAHIGFDNAVEVAITTYLSLHPIQRGNRQYAKDQVQRWTANYHNKLEFLQQEAENRGWTLRIPNDEVVFYHQIRNEQYHGGIAGIPDTDHIASLRTAALDTFAMLFEIPDLEQLLNECVGDRRSTTGGQPPRSATVDRLLDMAAEPVVIASQLYALSEALYAIDADAYGTMVAAVTESRNIVADLYSEYKDHMQPEISYVGFVHYEDIVYLKVVDDLGNVGLTNTDFIDGDASDGRFFSCTRSPDENADLLVQDTDAFSIINGFICG